MTEPANTPGDDRGREAQVEQYPGEDRDRLFFLLCDVIGTELRRHDYAWNAGTCACGGRTDDDTAEDEHPAVEVASAVTEGLQKRRADVLRALAAPAETEAGDLPSCGCDPDDEEVRSWAELADEFAGTAASAEQHSRQHERETGRADLYALGRASGRSEAEARIRHLIPRLAATPPAPEGEAGSGTARRGLGDPYPIAQAIDGVTADLDAWLSPRVDLVRVLLDVANTYVDRLIVEARTWTPPAPAGPQAEGETETGGAS